MDNETSNKQTIQIILANPQGKLATTKDLYKIRNGGLYNENYPLSNNFSSYLFTLDLGKKFKE